MSKQRKIKRKPIPGCAYCRRYVPSVRVIAVPSAIYGVTVTAVCASERHKLEARSER